MFINIELMNILFCIDKNYNKQCYVSIHSLIESGNDLENIFIIHKQPNTFNKELIKNRSEINIHLINFDEKVFNKLKNKASDEVAHVTIATYFRLFIDSLLPKNISDLIYIDADVISIKNFNQDSSDIFSKMNKKNYVLAARTSGDMKGNSENFQRLDLKNEKYFNAGVLFINLKLWREKEIENKLVNMLFSKSFKYMDQDILNKYFDGDYLDLPTSLNYFIPVETNYQKEVDKFVFDEAILLHYVGYSKPWDKKYFKTKNSTYYQNYYKDLFGNFHIKRRNLWSK